ncbi:Arm DNA-binding domain-containing protein [Thiobacillus sp.]
MGRKSETGGVTPLGDRIQVRFSWRGRELRPTLDIRPTAANLKHARRIREAVVADIRAGVFNLAEYFPDYKFAEKHTADALGRTFRQWADLWVELSARNLEDSTLRIYKRHLAAYWTAAFGDDMPKAVTHERVLRHLARLATEHLDERTGKLVKPLSRKTQNNILIPLRGVFELACKADPHLRNPTDGIDNLKVQKAQPDPFDPEEVEVILAALRERFGDEYADYFEFACFAGPRPSEQIALLWQDVDLRSGVVKVRRARVMAKDKERTKTAYEREVELNARALAVIERQRARTQLKGEHVFRNPSTGRPWNDEQEQRKVWVIALRTAKIRYRPPKECRDTSVTVALMAGADPLWVAKQHGHSVTVMMKDYARWIPKADRGRNLETLNRALGVVDSAVKPQLSEA